MPIQIGENPEGTKGINKFLGIGKDNDGYRGKIIALKEDKKEAIILAMNGKWGELLLVKETDPKSWPKAIKEVKEIPNTEDWVIV